MGSLTRLMRVVPLALLVATSLVACSGGDAGTGMYNQNTSGTGTGTGTGTGGTTSTAATIEVMASLNAVGTGGEKVTLTAVVKNSGNVVVPQAPVQFATNTGILTAPTVADANGMAVAQFTAGSDKGNRTATITVTSGSASGSLNLPISGSKLVVSGSSTLALNAQTPLTVKALDSAGNVIPNITVLIKSALGNSVLPASGTTDSAGMVSLQYTAIKSGVDTVNFEWVGSTSSATQLTVSGDNFVFVQPAALTQIPVGSLTSTPVMVKFQQNNVPVANKTVSFAATGGVLDATVAVTDSQGVATNGVRSNFSGPVTIQATVGASQTSLPIEFIATQPSSMTVQVTPASIGPNPNAAQGVKPNSTQIVAKVLDPNGNPVPGVTVNFSRKADPSNGDISAASTATDINGLALVQYFSGPNSTQNNGVWLHAEVAGNSAVSGDTYLTVSQKALFISLGTGNTMTNIDPQTYRRDWTVIVLDGTGAPVANQQLTVKILPNSYRKGVMAWDAIATQWVSRLWDPSKPTQLLPIIGASIVGVADGYYIPCANEDANFNGVLDVAEDVNGNGRIEPGGVIAVASTNAAGGIATSTTLTTDATGRATIALIYPESYAYWVEVKLQVLAQVGGTAGVAEAVFVVEGLSADFSDSKVAPAGRVSPFGQATTCSIPQ